eukprot:1492112-Prymnesium_polylepis.1
MLKSGESGSLLSLVRLLRAGLESLSETSMWFWLKSSGEGEWQPGPTGTRALSIVSRPWTQGLGQPQDPGPWTLARTRQHRGASRIGIQNEHTTRASGWQVAHEFYVGFVRRVILVVRTARSCVRGRDMCAFVEDTRTSYNLQVHVCTRLCE